MGLFERCMKRRGVKENDPYDWEKGGNAVDNALPPTNTSTSPAIISRTAPGAHVGHHGTNNNQENIEPDNKKELEVGTLGCMCMNYVILHNMTFLQVFHCEYPCQYHRHSWTLLLTSDGG